MTWIDVEVDPDAADPEPNAERRVDVRMVEIEKRLEQEFGREIDEAWYDGGLPSAGRLAEIAAEAFLGLCIEIAEDTDDCWGGY